MDGAAKQDNCFSFRRRNDLRHRYRVLAECEWPQGPGRNKTRTLVTRGLGKGYVDELVEVSVKCLYTLEPCPANTREGSL